MRFQGWWLILGLISSSIAAEAKDYFVYAGTYTGKGSKGIYRMRFDSASGKLSAPELAAESDNPSFLAVDAKGRYLYAVNEATTGDGEVSAFQINPASGALTALNKVSSHGGSPCHLSFDKTGKWILIANYTGGSVASFPVLDDGKLGEAVSVIKHRGKSIDLNRQEGPHAHAIETTADNRFALVPDLGADQIVVYHFDAASGKLSPSDPPVGKAHAGAGPRHLVFAPGHASLLVLNELDSTISTYSNNSGTLKELHSVSTLPQGFSGHNTTAEIAIDHSGKLVYASNRGVDDIAVFKLEAGSEKLTPVQHMPTGGKTPRHFAIDPSGKFLFAENQDSDTIVRFQINQKSGELAATGDTVSLPAPICLVFVAVK